ncbi:hypothetical protein BDZ89DRAFT_1068628 [Hymenopellis radicata]|nr:hypothetical protein BDZ89DRAFT_1068628 [Hymenopellis radicata]
MRNYGNIPDDTTSQHSRTRHPWNQYHSPRLTLNHRAYPTPTQSFPQPPAKVKYRDFRPDLPIPQSASQQAAKHIKVLVCKPAAQA